VPLNLPLLGLLGAGWELGVGVTGTAWNPDSRSAGFALADGTLVLARAEWPGGPQIGSRAGGGLEVRPPADPNPPVARLRLHRGACLALAADPKRGFLTGGADGKLIAVGTDGETLMLGTPSGRAIGCVAANGACARVGAAGREILVFDPRRRTYEAEGEVAALAFDPVGNRLVIAHQAGIAMLSRTGGGLRRLLASGPACALAWSPGGHWLAVATAHGLRVWRAGRGAVRMIDTASPETPRTLAFTGDGRFLALSGCERPICWCFGATGPEASALPPACATGSHRSARWRATPRSLCSPSVTITARCCCAGRALMRR
jgi:hypothetical protein